MMKKWIRGAVLSLGLGLCVLLPSVEVSAKHQDTIKNGVRAEELSLAGMTAEEASAVIEDYVAGLRDCEINLLIGDEATVTVTAGELGIAWGNPELVDEALTLGTRGNIVQRYKALADLEHENKVYPIELSFDIAAIDQVLQEQCSRYNRDAVDMSLVRENGSFRVVEGQTGCLLDVETSIDTIYEYLTAEWNRDTCSITLDVEITQPRGTEEQLLQVKDVLGTFTTSFSSSGQSRSANVTNGCRLIDGTLLYPGDEFSTYETVAPFSEANGYYMAGSYLNGKVVDSIGGGICQVSTTLYNAVLLAELDVTMRYNHSMVVSYVDPSADAAIAESSGKDFKFVNNTDYPIYIEGTVSKDKKISFTVYGVEVRDPGRVVSFVSEVLETTEPSAEVIYTDASRPIGFVDVSSAHTGYKARLWKVVTQDGVEISREIVNKSSYKMSPRSAVVGIATSDPNAYNEIMAAISTNSIDHVKNVAAMLSAPPAASEEPQQ